ncbi:MAG: 16S rRNA (cytidine(1402)-2'-O)-methyltransferase [Desulfatiglandaceae bacterium]|jgi:16S rRNA (cytidine1402-2'-O)-methyltransferase
MKNQIRKHEDRKSSGPGVLYVVSTPIGNLEDITLRALKILKNVDMIAAENVSHTRRLCDHYGIRTRVTRYNQHNQKAKASELIRQLKEGSQVAQVTDAGVPGISDPGGYLVGLASAESIAITPVPGPSAVTGALSISGFPAEQFLFAGFLPPKKGKRRKALQELSEDYRTMVFFEAPHRLKAMLGDLLDLLGNRQMVIVREMTKLYEEILRGSLAEILVNLPKDKIKGELTLVVQGKQESRKVTEIPEGLLDRIDDLIKKDGMSIRDIAEIISSEERLSYRFVYKACLSRKTVHQRPEVG